MGRRDLLLVVLLALALSGCAGVTPAPMSAADVAGLDLPATASEVPVRDGWVVLVYAIGTGAIFVCGVVDLILLPVYAARSGDRDFFFPCCRWVLELH